MENPGFSHWIVFALSGELDMSRISELDALFAPALCGEPVKALVDFSDVTFMDSSALGWLLKVQDEVDKADGKLHLVAPAEGSLMRLLSLSGLTDRFAVFASRGAAEQSLSQPDEIDDLLASFPSPGSPGTAPLFRTIGDGDLWQRATDAGYMEWTGLGHRLTDKGRARTNRINQG